MLRRAHQRNVATFLEITATFKITPQQFAVLKALEELGPCTQRRISSHIAMEPSNMHPMLRRMQDGGLVMIGPDQEDKRRSIISMTEAGRAMLEQIQPLELQSGELLLEVLSNDEKEIFLQLLARVAKQNDFEL